MTALRISADMKVNGQMARIAGRQPFMVLPAGPDGAWAGWMLADVTKANCITFADGLKAIFDARENLVALAQDLNARAAP